MQFREAVKVTARDLEWQALRYPTQDRESEAIRERLRKKEWKQKNAPSRHLTNQERQAKLDFNS